MKLKNYTEARRIPGTWIAAAVLLTIVVTLLALVSVVVAAGTLFLAVVTVIAVQAPRALAPTMLALAIAASTGVGVRYFPEGYGYSTLRFLTAAIALILLLYAFPKAIELVTRELFLLVFVAWSALSLSWSSAPEVSISLMGTILAALAIGLLLALHDPGLVVRLLFWVASALIGISIILIFIAPPLGFVSTWRPGEGTVLRAVGVFPWNSDFGILGAIVAVLATGLWITTRKSGYVIGVAVGLAATVLSASATAILCSVSAIFVSVIVGVRRVRLFFAIAGLVALVGFLVIGSDSLSAQIFNGVGRSSDLTGRTAIWPVAQDIIGASPWFGYGIGSAPDMSSLLGFDVGHAHSGYLQILLEVGIVGAAVFFTGVVFAGVRVVRGGNPVAAGVLTLFLVSNIANNYLMYAGVVVVLYGWVAFSSVSVKSLRSSVNWVDFRFPARRTGVSFGARPTRISNRPADTRRGYFADTFIH